MEQSKSAIIGFITAITIVVLVSVAAVRAYGKEAIPEDIQDRIDLIQSATERIDDNSEAYQQYVRDQKIIEEQQNALKEEGFVFGDDGLSRIDPKA